MKEFAGKTAVVTGGASGIGKAMALRWGSLGMKVALADVEPDALQDTTLELQKQGIEVLPVVTDVREAEQVQALAEKSREAFGAVHLICNNAGVFAGGTVWESAVEDYAWQMGVNLWGVIHGLRSFVPILIEQDEEAHIVNTASMAAVTTLPFAGVYHMTKHAVLALSECLYHELKLTAPKVGVSALCPELVKTQIDAAERNRPTGLRSQAPPSPGQAAAQAAIRSGVAGGIDPAQIALRVERAVREDRFYILSDEGFRRSCETRLEDVRLGRNPTLDPPAME